MVMTPRERRLIVLAHKEPDKVPLTAQLCLDLRTKLRKHYGVRTDEKLYDELGIDNGVAGVAKSAPKSWKPTPEYVNFCKQIGSSPKGDYANLEEWGVQRRLGVSKNGYSLRQFFFTRHPWESFTTPKQVMDAKIPDDFGSPGRLERAEKTIETMRDTRLIMGMLFHALWTRAWELRGMLTFMKDLHANPEIAEAILERLVDYNCELADIFLNMGVDGLSMNEDWGNNHSLFISPTLWRRYFKPRYKKIFDRAKRQGKFVFFHSDGNITPIVGDLVEIGIDSLNPVQPECMDQLDIKKRYGDKITIDTGISVQRTLPFGTVEDVKREALYALKHLAPGGGFVYGTSHSAMYEVPVENVVTLYETCNKYGKYPIRIPS